MLKRLFVILALIIHANPAQAAFFSFAYEGIVQSSPSTEAVTLSGDAWPADVPLPPYLYEKGDKLVITLSGTLASPDTITPDPVDGLIRYNVLGSISIPGQPNGAYITDVQLDRLDRDADVQRLFGLNNTTIVYDPKSGSYSLETGPNIFIGTFNLPVYTLSEDANGVRTARLDENPDVLTQLGWSNATRETTPNDIYLEGTDISFGTRDTIVGHTGPLHISGGFGNLSVIPDGPVDVPAPPIFLLLAAGAGALAWRRRKVPTHRG